MDHATGNKQIEVKQSFDGETTSDIPRKTSKPRIRSRRKNDDAEDSSKRRCVSTACIACRYVLHPDRDHLPG